MGAYGSTAMQRATRRMKKQQQHVAATRAMGMLSGGAAPAAYLVLDGPTGFATAAFLGFAALFLLINSTGK